MALWGRLGIAGAIMTGIHEFALEPMAQGLGWGNLQKNWEDLSEAMARMAEVLSGQRDWNTGRPIEINMQIDENRRVTAASNDMQTRVNTTLNRGWFYESGFNTP